MTILRAIKKRANSSTLLLLGLCGFLLSSPLTLQAAERVQTHAEAMEKKGTDGFIVYCYGPDWNARSVRMLRSFWLRPEVMTAAGEAILLAVPYYEVSPTPEELEKQGEGVLAPADIQGGLPWPPFSVCPTVLMYDGQGKLYAKLVGSDYLGDELGDLGIENIRKNLELLRRRDALMSQAGSMPAGAARSKLLIEASQLGIEPPEGVKGMLAEATDAASQKMLGYFNHDAIQFMYKQLDTTDGFLKEDFIEDVPVIQKAVMEVFKDENYRPIDRQAALNLYLGARRRDGTAGSRLRNDIRKNEKVGEDTLYGKAMAHLVKSWGSLKAVRKTGDEKRALRAKERSNKAKERDQKGAQEAISID